MIYDKCRDSGMYTARDRFDKPVQAGDIVRYVGHQLDDKINYGERLTVHDVTPEGYLEFINRELNVTEMYPPKCFELAESSSGGYETKREVMTTNDKFVVMFADDEPKVLTYIDIVEHINKGWINLEDDIIYELGSKIDVLLDVEFRQVHNARS